MSTKGFTKGKWNGLVNYQCDFCSYATPGEPGLARIKKHVAEHFLRGETPTEVAEATLDFASDEAADLFSGLDEDARYAAARVLMDSKPSGLTGFTVADVRAATNTEEG